MITISIVKTVIYKEIEWLWQQFFTWLRQNESVTSYFGIFAFIGFSVMFWKWNLWNSLSNSCSFFFLNFLSYTDLKVGIKESFLILARGTDPNYPWFRFMSSSTLTGGYPLQYSWAFLVTPVGKVSACNAGDLGLIPGLGRSFGEWNSYPLQYSGLENPIDYTVPQVTKSRHNWATFTLVYIIKHLI